MIYLLWNCQVPSLLSESQGNPSHWRRTLIFHLSLWAGIIIKRIAVQDLSFLRNCEIILFFPLESSMQGAKPISKKGLPNSKRCSMVKITLLLHEIHLYKGHFSFKGRGEKIPRCLVFLNEQTGKLLWLEMKQHCALFYHYENSPTTSSRKLQREVIIWGGVEKLAKLYMWTPDAVYIKSGWGVFTRSFTMFLFFRVSFSTITCWP